MEYEAGLASCSPYPGPRVEELADLPVVVVVVHGGQVHGVRVHSRSGQEVTGHCRMGGLVSETVELDSSRNILSSFHRCRVNSAVSAVHNLDSTEILLDGG